MFVISLMPNYFRASLLCRKIAVALCGFYFVQWDRKKRCRVLCSDTALLLSVLLCAFSSFSAPLSRLTPIEALPQAPLGALPPDPHNGFHPLPLDFLLASLGVVFYFELVFPLNYAEICAILKKIHYRG